MISAEKLLKNNEHFQFFGNANANEFLKTLYCGEDKVM